MTSPAIEAAAASTRTEFEARGLTALKAAALAAKEAFYGHSYSGDPTDIDAQIAFDIEEARLRRASALARKAYEDALEAFLKVAA